MKIIKCGVVAKHLGRMKEKLVQFLFNPFHGPCSEYPIHHYYKAESVREGSVCPRVGTIVIKVQRERNIDIGTRL